MHVESKKEQDSKRGVFTSRIGEEESNKPSVIPYLQSSLQGAKERLNSLKGMVNNSMDQEKQNMSVSDPLRLSELGYSYSNTIINTNTNTYAPQPPLQPHMQEIRRTLTPPKTHFTYENPKPSLTTIPVGPVSGHSQPYIPSLPLYSGGQQVHFMPIDNRAESVEVRRTVVPVHYTNQIPARIVVNAAPNLNLTPPYKPHEDQQNDEAYEVLLKQYTKLYERLGKTEQYANELEDELTKIRQKTNLPDKPRPANKRKYSLNVQQLHNKLYRIYQAMVNDVITKRKQSGRQKMSQLFASARKQMISVSTSVEVVTSSYKLG